MNAQTRTKVDGNPEAHAEAAAKANAKRADRKARMAQEEREQARADENVKRREQARAERAKAEAEAEAEEKAKKNEAGIKAEDKAELLNLVKSRTRAEIKGWLLFKGYTAKLAVAILEEYMPKVEKSERAKSLRDHLWAYCSTRIMSDEDFNSLMSTGTPNEVKHRKTFDNERLMFNKIHNSYK